MGKLSLGCHLMPRDPDKCARIKDGVMFLLWSGLAGPSLVVRSVPCIVPAGTHSLDRM